MFTLQSNAIITALRGSDLPDASAQDMVNAMCNCAQTIEHRGSMDFTYQPPWSNNYPGLEPPPGRVEPFTPTTGRAPALLPQIPIPQVSPWQNIPWETIGTPPQQPPWVPPATVTIPGTVKTGKVDTGTVTMTAVTNTGPTYNAGPVYHGGDTQVDGSITVQGDTNLGDTTTTNIINEGDQFIGGDVNVNGMFVQLGPSFHAGPSFFGGPINVNVNARLANMNMKLITYVSAVRFDAANNKLLAERRTAGVFGMFDVRVAPQTIVSTEACTGGG